MAALILSPFLTVAVDTVIKPLESDLITTWPGPHQAQEKGRYARFGKADEVVFCDNCPSWSLKNVRNFKRQLHNTTLVGEVYLALASLVCKQWKLQSWCLCTDLLQFFFSFFPQFWYSLQLVRVLFLLSTPVKTVLNAKFVFFPLLS